MEHRRNGFRSRDLDVGPRQPSPRGAAPSSDPASPQSVTDVLFRTDPAHRLPASLGKDQCSPGGRFGRPLFDEKPSPATARFGTQPGASFNGIPDHFPCHLSAMSGPVETKSRAQSRVPRASCGATGRATCASACHFLRRTVGSEGRYQLALVDEHRRRMSTAPRATSCQQRAASWERKSLQRSRELTQLCS